MVLEQVPVPAVPAADVLQPQQIFNGINLAERLEREILVVHNHVILALLLCQMPDVREHRHGNDYLSSVSQIGRHSTALNVEVKLLDSQIRVFVLTHIICP